MTDATPSFGVKSVLGRDIINLTKCLSDSKIICEYLTFTGDHHLLYVHLPVENLDQTRSGKGEIPTKGRMAGKNTSKFTENKNNHTDYYCEDCMLDEGNDPTKIYTNL